MSVFVLNYREQKPDGLTAFDTTSRSTSFARNLSPMLVDPFDSNGVRCYTVENGWQYSKVYPQHVDEHKEPTTAYFEWRNAGYNNRRGVRYPMGKGAAPLYSWWYGKKLDYISARKKIYIPLYRDAVRKTVAYRKLEEQYKKLHNIVLLDFDAYDHRKLGMSWHDVINCREKKMGHAFVLAMMLESAKVYE